VGCTHGSATAPATTTTSAPSQTIDWTTCSGHASWQCAHLSVPLDYANPAGKTITIAINRHRATGIPLLVNPGGPGAPGLGFAYSLQSQAEFASLFKHFDVVGFDPRGVGQSTPIRCLDGPQLDQYNHIDPDPTTATKLRQLIAGVRALDAACTLRSGGLLGHVSTADAARDMDSIRSALGVPTVTYLGFSYGTFLGETYASLFPTHVRALALDSVLDPAVDEGTMSIDQAAAFEHNLNSFLATFPGGRAAFDRVIARLPLSTSSGRMLGPGETFLAVADFLYSPATWPDLTDALQQAQQGDGSGLLSGFDGYIGRSPDGTYDNSEVSNAAINCLDRPSPGSIGAFQALAATASRQAPFFGAAVVWGDLPCLYWPVPPSGKVGPLHASGAAPILVIGSTGDPATPYAWAVSVSKELGAILITRNGEGHGAYLVSQCVRNAVDAYLENLVDPATGAVCAS
jgi:pimeloyl-ACP methyl ester carboxylesterase